MALMMGIDPGDETTLDRASDLGIAFQLANIARDVAEDAAADRDECNRPDTTLEGLASLKPVMGEGHTITAGNASQLSDGSSACVVMEARVAEKRGLQPLGRYVGMAVAGTEPDEMGIGTVFAIPRLLERIEHKLDEIGLGEINEIGR